MALSDLLRKANELRGLGAILDVAEGRAVYRDTPFGRFGKPVEIEWDGAGYVVDLSDHMPRNLHTGKRFVLVFGPPHGGGEGLWDGGMYRPMSIENLLRRAEGARVFRVPEGSTIGMETALVTQELPPKPI